MTPGALHRNLRDGLRLLPKQGLRLPKELEVETQKRAFILPEQLACADVHERNSSNCVLENNNDLSA